MEHKSAARRASTMADARTRRTAASLREALLALLKRKPLDQITVREIAAEAGIHYATFFRHHTTKEALLDHIAADQIDRLVELTLPVLDSSDSRTAFTTLCAYVDEHRLLWAALLTGGAGGAMREELLGISRGLAAARSTSDGWLPVDLAVVTTVTLIVETLAWWLRQPRDAYPVEEVARILHRLVLGASLQLDPSR
jgi:AcrR family transcriptional regulator